MQLLRAVALQTAGGNLKRQPGSGSGFQIGEVLQAELGWLPVQQIVTRIWGSTEKARQLCEAYRARVQPIPPADIHLKRFIALVLRAKSKANPIGYVLACKFEPLDKEINEARRWGRGSRMIYDERNPIDAGDTVIHAPSGETWLVAAIEEEHLSPQGWPMTVANLADSNM